MKKIIDFIDKHFFLALIIGIIKGLIIACIFTPFMFIAMAGGYIQFMLPTIILMYYTNSYTLSAIIGISFTIFLFCYLIRYIKQYVFSIFFSILWIWSFILMILSPTFKILHKVLFFIVMSAGLYSNWDDSLSELIKDIKKHIMIQKYDKDYLEEAIELKKEQDNIDIDDDFYI